MLRVLLFGSMLGPLIFGNSHIILRSDTKNGANHAWLQGFGKVALVELV